MIDTPTIDWAGLSPYFAVLAGAGLIMLVAFVSIEDRTGLSSGSKKSRMDRHKPICIPSYFVNEKFVNARTRQPQYPITNG